MTELGLLFMKQAGLSDVESKEIIELLSGLDDDLSDERIEEAKLFLIENGALERQECEGVISLLLETIK